MASDKPVVRIHTAECYRRQQQQMVKAFDLGLARGKYLAKYPDVCPRCQGQGMIHLPSSHYDEPDDDEPCWGVEKRPCYDSGYCPRCAKPFTGEDADTCEACGWEFLKPDVAPPDFGDYFDFDECECERSLLEQQLKAESQRDMTDWLMEDRWPEEI